MPRSLLALVLLAGCARSQSEAVVDEAAAPQSVTVHVAFAQLIPLADTIEGIGRCESLPNRTASVTAAVEGQVAKVLATIGDRVRAGQPIIELDRALARSDLAEKQATRDAIAAALKLLQAGPRAEERKAYELAIEQSKVAQQRAAAVVDQLRPLRSRGEVSDQQFFEAEKLLRQAELQTETSRAQFQLLLTGPKPEAIEEAKARLLAAEQTVAHSQELLRLHQLRAPIEGVLDNIACHLGQTLSVGTAAAEVIDTSKVYATAWLPPASAARVERGQGATVRLASADKGHDSPPSVAGAARAAGLKGSVDSVGKVVDVQTGNLPVRVLIDNSASALAIGQTVNVRITVARARPRLSVPLTAVMDLGEGPFVAVVRGGKTVLLHPRSIEVYQDRGVVIGTDLREGEPIVVEGGYNLPEGTAVQIAAATRSKRRSP